MIEKKTEKRAEKGIERMPFVQKALGRNNYICMIIAGVMIVGGFLLMLGGASTEEAFNPDIFSTRRIVVGPAIAFLGFVLMAVAVCLMPKASEGDK